MNGLAVVGGVVRPLLVVAGAPLLIGLMPSGRLRLAVFASANTAFVP